VPDNAAQLQAAGVRIANVPAASWEHLDFNFTYAPFQDHAVREAMISAINRQRIVDIVYKGGASVQNGVVPSVSWFSLENPDFAKTYGINDKLPTYAYDVNHAKQLLDQAGWVVGADGIRTKGGKRLSFEYGTTINRTRQNIQQLVQADLHAVGIEANVKSYSSSEYFGCGGLLARGQCQLCQFAWTGSDATNFDTWDTSQIVTPDNLCLQNAQHYSNPKVDEANRNYQADIARKDIAQYGAQAQIELMRDIALIPVVQRSNIELVNASLQNHKETNSQASSFWNITQWYFK
jgi:peptide/nickel transport system substrate-binding protein